MVPLNYTQFFCSHIEAPTHTHTCTLALIRIFVQLLWPWLLRQWLVDVTDGGCEVVGRRKQYRARRWRSTSVTSEQRKETIF